MIHDMLKAKNCAKFFIEGPIEATFVNIAICQQTYKI